MTATKTQKTNSKSSPIRNAIIERLHQLDLTIYQFAHSGKVSAAPSTIYRFLNGDVESSSGNLDEMLAALGLCIKNTATPVWARDARRSRLDREAAAAAKSE